MPERARHIYDPYSTHQPVLYTALRHTGGPVIEFGCGHGSTPLLHRYCEARQRELWTLDSDRGWLDLFVGLQSRWHHFVHVTSWVDALSDEKIVNRSWAVAFVDQSPWEARQLTIQAIRFTARFIVLHDCDYYPEHNLFGVNMAPLGGARNRGSRTYDDVFKYWREHFPLEPWPYERTGPPTLIGSNFEPCDWDVGFGQYPHEESFV
jgi:hypothetical protein